MLRSGCGRDESHHAAFGAGAEQRALRSAQHLDPVEVEERRKDVDRAEPDMPALDRRIVDVNAGGRGAGLGVDAADVDVRILVVVIGRGAVAVALERDPGAQSRQVVDAAQPLRVEFFLAERGDADRNVLQSLAAAGRRDHDFFECAARRGLGIPGCAGGRANGRPGQLARSMPGSISSV